MANAQSDVTGRPAVQRAKLPKLGLVAMILLALASAAVGLKDPAGIAAEYQMNT